MRILLFSPQHMLRVSLSRGRDRIRRHDWTSPFWITLSTPLLYLKCSTLPSFINDSTPYIYIYIHIYKINIYYFFLYTVFYLSKYNDPEMEIEWPLRETPPMRQQYVEWKM